MKKKIPQNTKSSMDILNVRLTINALKKQLDDLAGLLSTKYSVLHHFPTDILCYIYSWFSLTELFAGMKVNKKWNLSLQRIIQRERKYQKLPKGSSYSISSLPRFTDSPPINFYYDGATQEYLVTACGEYFITSLKNPDQKPLIKRVSRHIAAWNGICRCSLPDTFESQHIIVGYSSVENKLGHIDPYTTILRYGYMDRLAIDQRFVYQLKFLYGMLYIYDLEEEKFWVQEGDLPYLEYFDFDDDEKEPGELLRLKVDEEHFYLLYVIRGQERLVCIETYQKLSNGEMGKRINSRMVPVPNDIDLEELRLDFQNDLLLLVFNRDIYTCIQVLDCSQNESFGLIYEGHFNYQWISKNNNRKKNNIKRNRLIHCLLKDSNQLCLLFERKPRKPEIVVLSLK